MARFVPALLFVGTKNGIPQKEFPFFESPLEGGCHLSHLLRVSVPWHTCHTEQIFGSDLLKTLSNEEGLVFMRVKCKVQGFQRPCYQTGSMDGVDGWIGGWVDGWMDGGWMACSASYRVCQKAFCHHGLLQIGVCLVLLSSRGPQSFGHQLAR